MSLHFFCTGLLNHSLTQALACGARLPVSDQKELLLTYGVIHLFVVSGAHALFLTRLLDRLPLSRCSKLFVLFAFVALCDFSAPILRAFFQKVLKQQRLIWLPQLVQIIFSSVLTFPIAWHKEELLSLSLSALFSSFVFSISKKNTNFDSHIFILSLPLFFYLLGLPHPMGVLLSGVGAVWVGVVLLPGSLLSLISKTAEHITIELWWLTLDFLNFIHIFLGSPAPPKWNSHNNFLIWVHIFILWIVLTKGRSIWKRKILFVQ